MRRARWAVAALAAVCLTTLAVPAASAAGPGLIIWAPAKQGAILRDQLADGFRGNPVTVVDKDAAGILRDLQTIDLARAPDVIWADATWTGELVRDRVVRRLPLSQGLRARFPQNVLAAFRYGYGDYGVPVTITNDALVTNLDLVPVGVTTFGELERIADRLVAAGDATVGLALGQHGPGDEYFLGSLFTGLGGYLFGKDQAGGLDPYNIGLASPGLLANAGRIDGWNESGLVSATLTPAQAARAFASGRAPFWITGPGSLVAINELPFDVAITPVPPIVRGIAPLPLLAVQGAMVTVYADRHGVGDLATTLVRRYFSSAAAQTALARATATVPAAADATVPAALRGFARAGSGGTPLPNIVQGGVLLLAFRQAWAAATAGDGAVPARTAFADAQRAVLQSIG